MGAAPFPHCELNSEMMMGNNHQNESLALEIIGSPAGSAIAQI